MPDANARRDKALEGIARSLDDIAGLLKRLEQNTRRFNVTNYPDDNKRPDPFDVPQLPQPGMEVGTRNPYINQQGREQEPEQSVHPYLRRSQPDASATAETVGSPYGNGDETHA